MNVSVWFKPFCLILYCKLVTDKLNFEKQSVLHNWFYHTIYFGSFKQYFIGIQSLFNSTLIVFCRQEGVVFLWHINNSPSFQHPYPRALPKLKPTYEIFTYTQKQPAFVIPLSKGHIDFWKNRLQPLSVSCIISWPSFSPPQMLRNQTASWQTIWFGLVASYFLNLILILCLYIKKCYMSLHVCTKISYT